MKSPYQVQQVFNADLGHKVWSLTRVDGTWLNADGAIAYNFDSEIRAIETLQEMSRRFYAAARQSVGTERDTSLYGGQS